MMFSSVIALILLATRCYSSGSHIYLPGKDRYLPNYDQIVPEDITCNGLWCVGGSNSSTISWTFPNGDIITTNNHNNRGVSADILYSSSEGQVLVLYPKAVSVFGVYTCQVKDRIFDGTIATEHIWIVQNDLSPSVKDYTCSLDDTLVFKESYAILISSYVENGAPTNIECSLEKYGFKSDPLIKLAEDRALVNGTNPLVRVSVGYLVKFSSTPCDIKCVVSNGASRRGSMFTCKLKNSGLSLPVATSIIVQQTQLVIQWEPVSPESLLSHYTVYEDTGYGVSKRRTLLTEVVVPAERKTKDVRIIANSHQEIPHTVLLPSIGYVQSKRCIETNLRLRFKAKGVEKNMEDDIKKFICSIGLPSNCVIMSSETVIVKHNCRYPCSEDCKQLRTRIRTSTRTKSRRHHFYETTRSKKSNKKRRHKTRKTRPNSKPRTKTLTRTKTSKIKTKKGPKRRGLKQKRPEKEHPKAI